MISAKLDAILKNFLLRNISLVLNDKSIAEGKLISYLMNIDRNGFFLEVTLVNNKNKIRSNKIPFPFQYEYHSDDNVLYFDYRLSTMFSENDIEDFFTKPTEIPNRFYNQILEICEFIEHGELINSIQLN